MRLLPWWRRGKARNDRQARDDDHRDADLPARRPTRSVAGPAHWRRLAPLAPTVRPFRLTIAATMGVFADESRRPLIHHQPGRRFRAVVRRADGSEPTVPDATVPDATAPVAATDEVTVAEPAVGRVTGLVVVRAEASPELQPGPAISAPTRTRAPVSESAAATQPAPAAARLTSRVVASGSPRPTLLKAADEYVGAPEPDATPYASSAWLRMVESYRPTWAGGAVPPPVPSPVSPGADGWTAPPIPEGGGTWSSEAVIAPPRAAPAAPPDTPKPRRASLAESRRRGLSAPPRPAPPGSPDAPEPDFSDPPTVGESVADADPVADSDEPPRATPGSPVRASERAGTPAAPRLGLAAPIDRPVRHARGTSSEGRPAPSHTPPPSAAPRPARPDPQPRPQPASDTAPEAAARPEGFVQPPRPSPPRQPLPVYRFVPGEWPRQAAAPAARPTPPAPTPTGPAPTPPRAAAAVSARVPEPTPTVPPTRAARSERGDVVPYEILDAVRRAQGVDVSDVPIHRGPSVADEARSLGARSFTRNAEVFLPAPEGPPDHPVARGLLAHELTHAAQQRVLGTALPAEGSPVGQALEAQAVAAERWARGLGADPATGAGAPATSATSWTAPWHAAPGIGVQRQAEDVMSVAGPDDASTPPAAPPTEPQTPPAPPHDEELGAARDKLIELSKRRPLDLDDPSDIEELSTRIYQRIHQWLRRELVVDRERAGRLGEAGPFGPAR